MKSLSQSLLRVNTARETGGRAKARTVRVPSCF
jgi:hypothetical protein